MYDRARFDLVFRTSATARLRSVLLVTSVVACGGPAVEQADHGHDEASLGAVHFDVSCSDDVTADFDRAVAFLHHMQYEESRAAFERIADADPACAMAHWGIAMTLFQPLWPERPGPDALERGWTEVGNARELVPGTDREADLVVAAGNLRANEPSGSAPAGGDWK